MEDNKQIKRSVAYKLAAICLLKGEYVRVNEDFTPSYVEIGDVRAARVNLLGVVVSFDGSSLIIDDGTGEIGVRNLESVNVPKNISLGDVVMIIGKPRGFDKEKYIVPEIIKKTTKEWMLVRKKETEKLCNVAKEKTEITQEEDNGILEEDINEQKSDQEILIEYINKKDSGAGVEIEEIIKDSGIKSCENVIEQMLKEGEIFENMPGKVKVLN